MLPRADDIIAYARKTAENAGQQLTKSQSRTRNGIINVGIAMVALGLGFSWLIGRSITRPLNGLSRVMARLADGDTTARIPVRPELATRSAIWRAPSSYSATT